MSKMSGHLSSTRPQTASVYVAHKKLMAANLDQDRKRVCLATLLTVAAFISMCTPPFARAAEPTLGDMSAVKGTTPSTSSQWHVLKIGQSGNGITYQGAVNNAIVFFGKTPIAKCRARHPEELKTSEVHVSPASPTGQYIAVFCADPEAASGVQLVNLKTKMFFAPGPHNLFQVLQPWISFSPDDRYAVLNQSGDEGNYEPLVLDLNTRRAKTLDAPLFPHEEGAQTTWLNDKTVKYRRSDACDDKSCNFVGTYDFEVNVSTMKVKRKRVGN